MTNLQKARLNAGLSQSQLAKAAGISLRTLQGYENGARNINGAAVVKALKIAKALNVKVEDILEKEPN